MKHPVLNTVWCAVLLLSQQANAQFGVTLGTTTSDTSNTGATRLYNAGAPAGPGIDPAEKGDPIWLVFDVDGDGVFAVGALTNPSTDGTQDGLRAALIDPDDYVVFTSIPGPLGGRIIQNQVGLPESLQTGGTGANHAGGTVKPAYALLFRSTDYSTSGSFGYDLTAQSGSIPQVGNVFLRIGQDVYADAFTFTVGGVQPPAQPAITNVTAQLNAETVEFGFSFFAETGASYTLLSTTNLADKPIVWVPEGASLPGANTQTNLTVTNSIQAHQRYYRLEAQRL